MHPSRAGETRSSIFPIERETCENKETAENFQDQLRISLRDEGFALSNHVTGFSVFFMPIPDPLRSPLRCRPARHQTAKCSSRPSSYSAGTSRKTALVLCQLVPSASINATARIQFRKGVGRLATVSQNAPTEATKFMKPSKRSGFTTYALACRR
jgi:hypothetical protein